MTAELDALFAAISRMLRARGKLGLTLNEEMELTHIANQIDPKCRPNAPVLRLVIPERTTADSYAQAQGLTADGDDPLGCA